MDNPAEETGRILKVASVICGSPARARHWYSNEPIEAFDNHTGEALVREGRVEDLLRYAQALEAGAAG